MLKFLKVLKITTGFGQYGHPQMLKSSGETAAILLLLHVSLRSAIELATFRLAPRCPVVNLTLPKYDIKAQTLYDYNSLSGIFCYF
jgi:hypothetical protein